MKTVIVAVPYGRVTRDILVSGFMSALKKRKDLRIVLLTPALSKKFFEKEFSGGNVVVEELRAWRPSIFERFFMEFRNALLAKSKSVETLELHYEHSKQLFFSSAGRLKARGFSKFFAHLLGRLLATALFHKTRLLRRLLKRLHCSLFPDKLYAELFEKYKPNLIFTMYSDYKGLDVPLLKRAFQEGIHSVAYIMSWDKLTSKGEFPVSVSRLIVWNNIVQNEAVKLHDYSPEDVFVCGVPQFDVYFQKKTLSRKQLFKEIGADPKKKLIAYTCATRKHAPFEHEVIEILYGMLKEKSLLTLCSS